MAIQFGLLPEGFIRKRYADIITAKESRARELFGESVNLRENSPLGLFIRLNAWEEARAWQVAEDVYFSRFVDTAEGTSLDMLVSYVGITRTPPISATGVITVTGEDETEIPAGFLVETDEGTQFRTTEGVTISGTTVDIDVEAVVPGDSGNVPSNTITTITNPAMGVTAVDNSSPITGGKDEEDDTDLRMRYKRSVSLPGSSTTSSIEAAILALDEVEDVYVQENDTESTVGGIPAKSINPLVLGGAAEDIAQEILDKKAAGIRSYGTSESVEIIDSHGNTHTIAFDRPSEVSIYCDVELEIDSTFPIDGITQVTNKILEYINALSLGEDVIYTRVIAAIQEIRGIIDIPVLEIDTTPSPEATSNVSIAYNELARTDVTKVLVAEAA